MLAAAILAGGQPTAILAIAYSNSALTSCLKTRQDPAMIPCVVSLGSLMNELGVQLIECARWHRHPSLDVFHRSSAIPKASVNPRTP